MVLSFSILDFFAFPFLRGQLFFESNLGFSISKELWIYISKVCVLLPLSYTGARQFTQSARNNHIWFKITQIICQVFKKNLKCFLYLDNKK